MAYLENTLTRGPPEMRVSEIIFPCEPLEKKGQVVIGVMHHHPPRAECPDLSERGERLHRAKGIKKSLQGCEGRRVSVD